MKFDFPYELQRNLMDCGPVCLKNICKYYDYDIPLEHIREVTGTTDIGTNLLGMVEGAKKLGFKSLAVKTSLKKIVDKAPFPLIAHLKYNHYVVLLGADRRSVLILDPSCGLDYCPLELFLAMWIGPMAEINTKQGVALLIARDGIGNP